VTSKPFLKKIPRDLGTLVNHCKRFTDSMKWVILNVYYSDNQDESFSHYIRYIIGMK
jgi:hypothetical protein